MGRLLILVVLAVVAVWLIRRVLVQASRARTGEGAQPGKPPVHGELVKCAHCGTHLPLPEARALGDRLYCSDEHARLGPGRG